MGVMDRVGRAWHALTATSDGAPSGEIGRPGTRHWAGRIQNGEYVPELLGSKALDVFERMRRSDGAVAATLRSLKLPLRSAKWDIEPPDDPSDLEREVADRLRWNLFEGMSMTWEDHLRQVLTSLEFGFYVCEKVWQISDDMPTTLPTLEFRRGRGDILNFARELGSDGRDSYRWDGSAAVVDRKTFYVGLGRFAREPMITLRKLAPRLQQTIDRWDMEPDGGLRTVVQRLPPGSDKTHAPMPIEKLLVFVNEKEGANWTGRSVLRPAYKHWLLKDALYRIHAINTERFGVGIPVMKLPDGKSDDKNLDRAEKILEGVRTNEKAYIVELFGYEFRIEGMGEGKVLDPLPMIQHHDWMIAVSVLAQHLMLGSTDTGSHALAGDITSLFLMVEEAHGRDVCAIHNRFLIPQWVAFNYPGVERLPKLTVGRIETRDTGKLLATIANGVQAGALTHDAELENWIRKQLGLPSVDPAALEERKKPAITSGDEEEPKDGDGDDKDGAPAVGDKEDLAARLSAREYEIALLVGEGLANKQIAARLGISDSTVEKHLAAAKEKLGLASKVDLGRWVALRRGPRAGDELSVVVRDLVRELGDRSDRSMDILLELVRATRDTSAQQARATLKAAERNAEATLALRAVVERATAVDQEVQRMSLPTGTRTDLARRFGKLQASLTEAIEAIAAAPSNDDVRMKQIEAAAARTRDELLGRLGAIERHVTTLKPSVTVQPAPPTPIQFKPQITAVAGETKVESRVVVAMPKKTRTKVTAKDIEGMPIETETEIVQKE